MIGILESKKYPVSAVSNLPDKFFAYYRLNGDATNDTNGAGTLHDGTAFNVTWVPGVSGQAASFPGSGYIEIPNNSAFNFTDGVGNDRPFSIGFSIKFDNLNNQQIIVKDGSSGVREWIFAYNGTTLTLVLLTPTASGIIRANYTWTPSVNTWYHIAGTYDGSETADGIELYVNGTIVAASKITTGTYTGMQNGGRPVFIGKSGTNTNFVFGDIDGVGFSNQELAPSDVAEWYNDYFLQGIELI